MKLTKYVPNLFSYYDHLGIARHLERMAAKGWMLVHTGSNFWKFRRVEPGTVHFAIIYTKDNASVCEPDQNEALEQLQEMCEGTGWEWTASHGRMHIFRNSEPDPVSLETDAAVQVSHIHQAMKRRYLPENITLLIISLLVGVLCLWSGASVGGSVLVLGCLGMLLFGLQTLEVATYLIWHRRAVRAAEGGVLLPSRSYPWINAAAIILATALVGVWLLTSGSLSGNTHFLLIIGSIYLLRWLSGCMRRENVAAGTHRAVIVFLAIILSFGMQFVLQAVQEYEARADESRIRTLEMDGTTYLLYQDEVPLKLEDLMEVDSNIQSYFRMDEDNILYDTVFVRQSQAGAFSSSPRLSYNIYLVRFPPAYDLALSKVLDENYQPLDPEVWGVTAYQEYADGSPSNSFILCLEDRIIIISFYLGDRQASISPTPEQIAVILEKLGQFTA